MKKAKFHYEAAAMLGCEGARCNIGSLESVYGNMGTSFKAFEDCCISWELSCHE